MISRYLPILLIAAVGTGGTAIAKDDDGRVERAGSCSGPSNWKLKAKPDDGRIEAEFEVDQNRTGVRWRVVMKRNGNKVLETAKVTRAPSGSFEVHLRFANGSGTDRISAFASRRSGETCRGSLRV